MTEKQIELGRHALGLPNDRRMSYRNHFVADLGHTDYTTWLAMVEQGDAFHGRPSELTGGDDLFWLTKKGAMLCLKPSEKLDPEDFKDA